MDPCVTADRGIVLRRFRISKSTKDFALRLSYAATIAMRTNRVRDRAVTFEVLLRRGAAT